MAPSHGSSHSEAAKMEQIVTEFFTKSLHIILESRSPYVSSRNFGGEQIMTSPSSSSSSSSSVRPRDKWFNLALRECPAALENHDLWRQSNLEPMVVDVVLVQRPLDWDPVSFSPKRDLVRNLSLDEGYPYCWNSDLDEFRCEPKREKIIERWVVQFESKKVKDNHSSGSRRPSSSTLHALYKKSILLLRSLYATVRLLPAYKIFRDLNSSGQIRPFGLAHRISSLVEPFSRQEEAEMQRFGFTPVETSSVRLCLSVLYRSSVMDISSESSTPISPQVIPDYVGSPLAEPLKRFPSLPVAGSGTHGSPSSLPFSGRHSWSYDYYRASPPVSFSPSPPHSESHASISNPSSRRLPPSSLPPHPPETLLAHKKNTSFDEYFPSPTFSPSPSPSPPIYIPGSHLSKGLLRSDSAPVNIPVGKLANSPALCNKQCLPPSPPIKNTRSSTFRTDNCVPSIQTSATVEQLFSLGKDETRKHFGRKISSNSSPSRSSSRSFHDDFDDSEFDCAFDVDDEDLTDLGSRPESFDQKGHLGEPLDPGGVFPTRKSQDAAVGALVHMLRKAPPLRTEFSTSVNLPHASEPEMKKNSLQERNPAVQHADSVSITSSGVVMLKTTADALEELQGYREMKNLLINQGRKS
ncbi:Autophagy-related protein 13 [Morella rubra]|uniref:Autophagy-related protein 13 n=1 Tax=Morella rubra TaxID=262757 RepID=A0A6A1V7S4_9ROSI|nr:Autophagy-related protein 13 [Morella rubra]